MTRKICLLLLALTLLLSAAACGKTPDTPTDAVTEAPVTDAPQTDAVQGPVLPDKDYGGLSVVIFAEDHLTVGEYAEFYLTDDEAVSTVSEAQRERTRRVEERLGVKISVSEPVSGQTMEPFNNSVAADAKEYALASGITSFMNESVMHGYFYDLMNDLRYIDLEQSWYPGYLNAEMEIMGRQFIACGAYDMATFSRTSAVFFSTELAEDYNMGDLYGLVEKNEWTYDTLFGIASKSANDVNGDGAWDEADQYGLCGGYNMNSMLITTTGYRFTTVDEDGVRRPTGVTETLLKFNDMLLDAYESNWYYNCQPYGGKNHFNDIAKPKFIENMYLFFLQDVSWSKNFSASMSDYGILPIPKLTPDQKDYVSYCRPAGTGVPIDADDPECASAVLEAMNWESSRTILPAYMTKALSSRYASSPEASRMMEIIFSNVACDFAQNWYASIGVSPNLHNSVGVNRNYVSYYNGIKEQITARLAEICATLGSLRRE